MNEFLLRFLVVGIIITILIGFGVWWFFIHNSADRIVERNAYKFREALGTACYAGEAEIEFEMPQPLIASLKDKFEDGVNWIKKKLFGGPEFEIPIQTLNDPYYKLYWEYFPPDPPYQFGQGALGTAASVFAPWSEDLPWTSNFFATVALDSFTLGLDIFGLKEIKGGLGKVAHSIGEKLESISPDTYAKLSKYWKAINDDAGVVIDKLGKAEQLTVKAGKIVLREGKFIGKVTAVYTGFCLVIKDETLGECLKEGVILGMGADVVKIVGQKYVVPKVNTYLKTKIAEVKRAFSLKIEDLKDMFSSYTEEEVAGSTDLANLFKEKGWQYDETIKKFRASRDFGTEAVENIINPLEEYAQEEFLITGTFPNKIGDFDIIYEDYESGTIKEVIYDRKTLSQRLNEKILYPLKEKIASLEERGVMADRVLDSDSFSTFSQHVKKYFEENPEKAREFLLQAGVKTESADEALRILSTKLTNLETEARDGLYFVVVEKDSEMDKLISKLDLYKTEIRFQLPRGEGALVEEYLENILKNKDSDEAKRLYDLIKGKRLRLKEDVEIFSRGTFGYMLMRVQDLYTPLGATYWDRYFSYYGYPSKELTKGFCETSCADGKICVQLGACVRQYDLPDTCAGIESIKLKRNSLVAPDPRFYLVSPCYSKLKIYRDGNTIYVEPYMSENSGNKNYCYATAGLVNWYVGTEIGSIATRCVSAVLCALGTSIGTGGMAAPFTIPDAIKACFGFGKATTGVCSAVSNLAGMLVDIYRESQLIYPDIYRNRPDLIDFKI